MPKRVKKVILLGSKGYERVGDEVRVQCFLWDQIRKVKNIRDFDTVIINVLNLKDEESRKKVSWNSFSALLTFRDTHDILQHGGTIIVLGDPRFRILNMEENIKSAGSKDNAETEFLDWTGIDFYWDSEPGDTVHFTNDYDYRHYENYAQKMTSWEYSLGHYELNKNIHEKYWNKDYLRRKNLELRIAQKHLCWNRYRNALAFILTYCFFNVSSDTVKEWFGPMIFLPRISLNEDETIQLVLRDICGVEVELPEPDWVVKLSAPGQDAIDTEITTIRNELEKTRPRLHEAQKKRAKIRECLKLLYEREYALEPVVRNILRGFGAEVEDPTEENKEDGWVVVKVGDKTYEGVLEIKSTRSNQFGEDGRKQLLDWVDRGRMLRQKNYKGIFIGNSAVDKPVGERQPAFSDSWKKAAELSGICAMKTEDLYVIYLLHSLGRVDLREFWANMFTTNGVIQMEHYWQLLPEKKNANSQT